MKISEILRKSAIECGMPKKHIDYFVKTGLKAWRKAAKETKKIKHPSEREFNKLLGRKD